MTQLSATQNGHIPKNAKGGRKPTPIRLTLAAHAELRQAADNEQRSMGFIALRRYMRGRELEQQAQNNASD